ncbi:adenosine kinase [Alphaproteobacteria bacterium]|jgi:sugar/nucleoside kinase (ribokinase family)|nr:adenosine kinase [Alphaproteobacteria bacterium]
MGKKTNVLTVGNAIVDVFARCEDQFLFDQEIGKGMMNLVDADRSAMLYSAISDQREISGGSAANTAVGIVMLGGSAGFTGRVHDDTLGHSFIREIRDAGVHFSAEPQNEGAPTASSIILVTPDATRSMNTYLGACIEFQPSDIREEDAAMAEIIYLEGYLYDAPQGPAIFDRAVQLARQHGARISLSLSDPWCAERHREELSRFTRDHVDILFANEDEAASLCDSTVEVAITRLCVEVDEAVVTRGPNGAFVGSGDDRHEIPARPLGDVVDTTGAGDLFAAGYLYGRTNGRSLRDSGTIASIAAGEVISHIGARPNNSIADLVDKAGV